MKLSDSFWIGNRPALQRGCNAGSLSNRWHGLPFPVATKTELPLFTPKRLAVFQHRFFRVVEREAKNPRGRTSNLRERHNGALATSHNVHPEASDAEIRIKSRLFRHAPRPICLLAPFCQLYLNLKSRVVTSLSAMGACTTAVSGSPTASSPDFCFKRVKCGVGRVVGASKCGEANSNRNKGCVVSRRAMHGAFWVLSPIQPASTILALSQGWFRRVPASSSSATVSSMCTALCLGQVRLLLPTRRLDTAMNTGSIKQKPEVTVPFLVRLHWVL